MGHTNSTTYYNLPQFLTSDKPAWLTDVNNAMADIDAAVHSAQSDATTAGTNASQALLDASAASAAASAADAKGAGACASIEATFDSTAVYSVGAKVMYNSLLYRCNVAVVTPGPWTGSANWERITVDSLINTTDSKVGNLASLATTDKSSVVNAMNEIKGQLDATHIRKIQCGTVNMDATTKAVTLTGFNSSPYISLTCLIYGKTAWVTNQSASGFTINVETSGTYVQYIAIDYVP